ncbi:hypothetical protein ACFHW1_05040 [Micromonospora sp. LOL_014]|uniref:hypothetical protein n=1 Tax=Micromonospora sp. LOL_014 TaxID=3345415 RepID=UPI003A87519C
MTPGDTARVLAKAAAFDQRTIGEADIAAWHEALADLDGADCLAAVTRHYATSEKRLMPVHVRAIAVEIRRERQQRDREADQRRQLAAYADNAVGVRDRSAEVGDLLARLAEKLGPSDPTVLRRREWVRHERHRRLSEAPPNPHYQGPPPPGGWPVPGQESA